MYLASFVISAFLLATTGWFGVALLRRAASSLTRLEHLAYGVPLGAVLASLTMLGVACLAGLTRGGVIAFAALFTVAAVLLSPWRLIFARLEQFRARAAAWFTEAPLAAAAAGARRIRWRSLLPALVLGAFVVRWAFLWSNALNYEAECLRAGTGAIWGDWPAHLGDTAAFAYGNNFPPQHPRFAGHAYAYHYLTSIMAAAAVKLGADPAYALTSQSFLLSIFCALAVYAFARRLTLSSAVATLALLLFFLGGGLGWLLTLGEMDRTDSFWQTLRQRPWDGSQQDKGRFLWLNIYFFFVVPQRGFLFGLPLALLIFTLLLEAVRQSGRRMFATAGAVAGLLPLAHLSSMLALAFITPLFALFLWSRRWLWFFGVWLAVALPQFYAQQGGGSGPVAATKLRLGWLAAPDPWLWFWLKNLGWFLPLLIFAVFDRTLAPREARRFLRACMGIFVATNVAQFQPWDWNNHIVMVYWFLAVCVLVAALLHKLWSRARAVPLRFVLACVVASMLLSGVLVNLQEAFGHGRHCVLSTEEVMLAKAVRDTTRRNAIFVAGLQNNHPITTLSGRKVVLGYPGWIWPQGIDPGQRERDVRAIYATPAQAPQLLRQYKVDYLIVGPEERRVLNARPAAFQKMYRLHLRTKNYEIYAVKKRLL